MYGTQTFHEGDCLATLFENDVKMYGTQTSVSRRRVSAGFENDVKMYGTQTILCAFGHPGSV